mgnify:CR=1 FL=1
MPDCDSPPCFFVLPDAAGTAAQNMALDTALLENFPRPQCARFRHYGWTGDCWTFGYGQRFADARAQTPPHATPVRRPSGGGVVDHREDWTYALVIPFAHPLCRMKAGESYVKIHSALAEALKTCGQPARLALCTESRAGALPACFMAPSPGDVVDSSGRKLAGAAQKRNRHGLLLQGSITRTGVFIDWDAFKIAFTKNLSRLLSAACVPMKELSSAPESLLERYHSARWNASR